MYVVPLGIDALSRTSETLLPPPSLKPYGVSLSSWDWPGFTCKPLVRLHALTRNDACFHAWFSYHDDGDVCGGALSSFVFCKMMGRLIRELAAIYPSSWEDSV